MDTATKTKTYVCKRERLCRHLIDHGFEPFRIVPDRNNPRYNVYLFARSEALDSVLFKYFEVIKRSTP